MSELGRLASRLGELTGDLGLAGRLSDVAATFGADGGRVDLALDRLRDAFRLSAFERDLVALVGLPEEHEALTTAARVLHPRGEPHTCVSAVAAVLRLDASGRHHLRVALETGP